MNRRRRLTYALLYFAEGAPIGFLWWTLPTAMRLDGGDLDAIGALLAALALPWAFKFLWAPLVDVARGPRWSTKSWLVAAQLLMAATLVPLVWLRPSQFLGPWSALLIVHAFAAATQDVAIDAIAIADVAPAERGSINAWMQAGMLLGRSVFGGAALYLRAWAGDGLVVGLLVATIATTTLIAWPLPDPPRDATHSLRAFRRHLHEAVSKRSTWLGLGFAATAGAGFEAAGAFAGPWLLERGASATQVGAFVGLAAVASMLIGGFLGGTAVDRVGRVPALFALVVLSAASVLASALAGALAAPLTVCMATLVGVYLALGALTSASYAHFMDLTSPRLGATQFSAFMGATNLCESWSTYTAGRIADRHGFGSAFATLAAVSLLSATWLLPERPWKSRRQP